MTFIFAYLAINLFKEYRFIRLFFLTLCMWSMTLTLGVFEEVAIINSASNLEGMMTAMMTSIMAVATLMTFIMFILGIITAINIWRGKDLDDDFDKEEGEDQENRRVFG